MIRPSLTSVYEARPFSRYLLAFSSSSSRVAEHLLEEGHGVRPSIEASAASGERSERSGRGLEGGAWHLGTLRGDP